MRELASDSFLRNHESFWLSWPVWLIGSLAPQAILSLMGNLTSPLFAVASILAAPIIAAPVFALGNVALARTHHRLAHRWIVIATIAAASLAISGASVLLSVAFGVSNEILITQMLAGAVMGAWFFSVTSVLVQHRRTFTRSMDRLEVLRAQVDSAQAWESTSLRETQQGEIRRITELLAHARDVYAHAETAGRDFSGFSDAIVRNHLAEIDQLHAVPEAIDLGTLSTKHRRVDLSATVRLAFSGTLKVALPTSLFIATTWFATGITLNDLGLALSAGLSGWLALWLALSATRALLGKLREPRTTVTRSMLTLTLWFLAGVFAGLPPLLLTELPMTTLVAVGLQSAFVTLAVSFIIGYQIAGSNLMQRLEDETRTLETTLTRNANLMREFRERLRQFIHGEAQSLLVAVERAIDTNAPSTPARISALMQELETLVREADQYLREPREIKSPVETFQDLQVIWSGLVELKLNGTEGALSAIESNIVTRNVMSELLIEIVTNGVKHDNANHIEIHICERDEYTLEIRSVCHWPNRDSSDLSSPKLILGKRQASSTHSKFGAGTMMFSEVCEDWEIVRSDNSTEFRASLPYTHLSSSDKNWSLA